MARRSDYVPDPQMVTVPLGVDELESLQAASGNPLRDQRAAAHFLSRVNATLRTYQAEVNRLHRQVSEISIRTAQTGAPSSLDPRDAVRFLPAGELAQLVEGHLRGQVSMLDRLTRDVTEQRQVAVAQVNRIKYLIVSIMEDPELDARTRARLERVWKALPPDEHLAASAHDVAAQLRAAFDAGVVPWLDDAGDGASPSTAVQAPAVQPRLEQPSPAPPSTAGPGAWAPPVDADALGSLFEEPPATAGATTTEVPQ
jgi:hypothetical protein